MKFHANAPACHPVPMLQPPPRTAGHPGLQEGGSGGKTEPREEPELPLMEVGGKAPRGAGSPCAAARPGALSRLEVRRVPQSDRLCQLHGAPPRRCQLGLGGLSAGEGESAATRSDPPRGGAHTRYRRGTRSVGGGGSGRDAGVQGVRGGMRSQGRCLQWALAAPYIHTLWASRARRAMGAGAGAPTVAWRALCPQNH